MKKKWMYERFIHDSAIYAFCPTCNFYYDASRFDAQTMKSEIAIQYNYCPMCGEYLYDDSETVDVIWKERDISELLKQGTNIEGESI